MSATPPAGTRPPATCELLVDATPRSGSAPTQATATARALPFGRVALALGVLFALGLSGLAIARHQAYASGQQDLEIYLQTLWNTAQGRPFATTLLKANDLHLAEHLALVLLPLTPLYGLLPDARPLLVLQEAGLALAGAPIWLVARRRLGPGAALALLGGFYLMPSLAGAALDDFHPVTLTAAPLAAAAMLLLEGRWRAGSCLALTSVLLEEEATLVVAGLGLWLLLARRPRWGGLLVGASVGLLLVATLVVMPGFHYPATVAAEGGNRSLNHFAELRANPGVVVGRLFGERGLDAVVSFLLPLGGTVLLAPWMALASLPSGLALFLQDRADTFRRHWAAPILPLLWLAAAAGIERVGRTSGRRLLPLGLVGVGTVLAFLLASPLPGGGAFEPDSLARGPHEADLDQAVAAVPTDAPLAVSANVAAHLANRSELYVYPIDDHYLSPLRYEQRRIDGYVLDLLEPSTLRVPPLGRNSPLLADPPYVVWSGGYKVLLLTRGYPTPQLSSGATFNRRMTLIGYDVARRGDRLGLTLTWQKTSGVFADFDRLAELVDPAGQVLARDQSLLLTSLFTTEKWKIGQVVVDRLDLPLAGDGPFRLRLAWLNRDRRTPLLVDGGGEALEIPVSLP